MCINIKEKQKVEENQMCFMEKKNEKKKKFFFTFYPAL